MTKEEFTKLRIGDILVDRLSSMEWVVVDAWSNETGSRFVKLMAIRRVA